MGKRKKPINNTDIPQYQIEAIARCILPDILAFYESEEGQREFSEWNKGIVKAGCHPKMVAPRLFCIYMDFFFFRGPLGLEVGLRSTPLRK